MKKVLLILTLSFISLNVSAQTKIAYCDVYARGGGKHMKITVMFNNTPYEMHPNGNRSNLGNILNELAADGWVLDNDIVIPRHETWSTLTRHKLHLIMKKEYQAGENPFLLFEKKALNDEESLSRNSKSKLNEDSMGSARSPRRDGMNDIPKNSPRKLNEDSINNTIADESEENTIIDDKVILLSESDRNGTWYDAMEYCRSLGDGWKLPNCEQLKYICENYDISFNCCWTDIEVNDKKAKAYDRGYALPYTNMLKSSDQISIIAVKVNNENIE